MGPFTGVSVLALSLVLLAGNAYSACSDACWENCFLQAGTGELSRFKEVYDSVVEIGLEIVALKNLYNITRIGWLIDSSVSSRFNQAENVFTERLENGNNIYKFEVMLAMVLTLIVNGQSNYLVQFDEESAWTCNEFSCISSACATVAALNRQSNVAMLPSSFCPGDVEAACKLLKTQITNIGCSASNQNAMVIAITNNDFFTSEGDNKVLKRKSNDDCPSSVWASVDSDELYSPCHSYFDTRYIIGTHSSSENVLKKFPSFHGNYKYLHDEKFSYNSLVYLLNCMLTTTNCCAATTSPTVNTCWKTQGLIGDIINSFPTHPAFTSGNNIFGATLPSSITTI